MKINNDHEKALHVCQNKSDEITGQSTLVVIYPKNLATGKTVSRSANQAF